jgi:hypothetical protein
MGHQVVVGLDTQDNELGVFFPTDGQLSHLMCEWNNLYSGSARAKLGWPVVDGEKYGFFSDKRRVRAQKFRGEKSDGFWCPMSYLDWVEGYDWDLLKEGDTFTKLGDVEICRKYYTPATLRAMANAGKAGKSKAYREVVFPEHVDTGQFRYNAHRVPANAVVYITEKLHGTSGRYGHVQEFTERPWFWQRWLYGKTKTEWKHLSGSRRVVLEKADGPGYYGSNTFRENLVNGLQLHKGEVLYFEIVGDVAVGQSIMPAHTVKDELKDLKKVYGDKMEYRYGCVPGEHKMFVYRITRLNEDGIETDLSWPQVQQRCAELNLMTVPEIGRLFLIDSEQGRQHLQQVVETATDGPSTLDPRQIREGVCVRVEGKDGTLFLKNKSWAFGVLEGYIKDAEDYVDLEEAS